MSEDLTEKQKQIKEGFTKERHYWDEELLGSFLRMAPDYLEAYLNYSAVPWKTGVLPPKVKELIYIAINAATTHLYAPGIRRHIRNALERGATKEEIVEVMGLVSALGSHSFTVGLPVLEEELKKAKRPVKK